MHDENRTVRTLLTYALAALVLVGCGGGGDADSQQEPTTRLAPAQPDQGDIQIIGAGSPGLLFGRNPTPEPSDSSFKWLLLAQPETSTAVIDNPDSPETFFVADAPGTYIAQFAPNNVTGASDRDVVVVEAIVGALVNHGFDHTGITSNCVLCHDGVTAPGKPADHIPSSDECEVCHSVLAFSPAVRFDHTGITDGCSACHDGATATGKPNDHPETTAECNVCHTTTSFDDDSDDDDVDEEVEDDDDEDDEVEDESSELDDEEEEDDD